ncbi:MAG: EamA family transporter [Candidatus Levyibacteriota bacterium]
MNFLIFSISSAFLFALTFYFRKLATKFISVPTAFYLEALVYVVLSLVIFFFLAPELKKGIDLRNKGVWFALLAGAGLFAGVGLNYLALKTGFLSRVVAVTSPSQIIFGVMLGILLSNETFTLQQAIGTLVTIIGMLLIILK